MVTVDINGKQIGYWEGKVGPSEGRETVLFIHGAGGGQNIWSYQKDFFEKRAHPIMIDLPGHGESGGKGADEIGRYAEHVYSFLKALHLRKVFVVGHSMGGAITQTLGLNYPEVIKGIVLVGTGARLRVLPLILDEIRNNFEETVRRINQFSYSRKAPPLLIEQGISDMMGCPSQVLYGDYLACDRFDIMGEVQRITLPTLIVCGTDDELTPIKYSRFLQNRIKGSRLEIIPDAGHMVMMESSHAFNEKVWEFIAETG